MLMNHFKQFNNKCSVCLHEWGFMKHFLKMIHDGQFANIHTSKRNVWLPKCLNQNILRLTLKCMF